MTQYLVLLILGRIWSMLLNRALLSKYKPSFLAYPVKLKGGTKRRNPKDHYTQKQWITREISMSRVHISQLGVYVMPYCQWSNISQRTGCIWSTSVQQTIFRSLNLCQSWFTVFEWAAETACILDLPISNAAFELHTERFTMTSPSWSLLAKSIRAKWDTTNWMEHVYPSVH